MKMEIIFRKDLSCLCNMQCLCIAKNALNCNALNCNAYAFVMLMNLNLKRHFYSDVRLYNDPFSIPHL